MAVKDLLDGNFQSLSSSSFFIDSFFLLLPFTRILLNQCLKRTISSLIAILILPWILIAGKWFLSARTIEPILRHLPSQVYRCHSAY